MTEIIIRIEIPDGAMVTLDAPGPGGPGPAAAPDKDEVQAYWDFCTENTQRLFTAMAEEELESGGPFDFDAVAERMGVSHSEVLTYNRNAGRGARLWRDRHDGEEPPIRLISAGYVAGRRRKTFRLPDGVPQTIIQTF